MNDTSAMSVRLPLSAKAWLASRAADNGRSMNAELLQIVKTMISAEPLYCVVRHCNLGSDEFFSAAVGESADDFFTGSTQEDAFAAARAKLRELGFDRAAIEFREECGHA